MTIDMGKLRFDGGLSATILLGACLFVLKPTAYVTVTDLALCGVMAYAHNEWISIAYLTASKN